MSCWVIFGLQTFETAQAAASETAAKPGALGGTSSLGAQKSLWTWSPKRSTPAPRPREFGKLVCFLRYLF